MPMLRIAERRLPLLLMIPVLAVSIEVGAQQNASPTSRQVTPRTGSDVQVLPVQGNIYLLSGLGSNVIVQVGEDGVLVVDTARAESSEKILAAIRALSNKPLRYVLNTNADPDHVGGNVTIAYSGVTYGSGPNTPGLNYAPIYAHENLLTRMSGAAGEAAMPAESWPTDTYFTESLELNFNGEAIQLLHMPMAHSDGDSVVVFRRSDVIAAGDVFITTGYPVIDLRHGGSINGIIDALNRIIDLAIPKENQEGGTMIVPGHGRIGDEYDVVVYRDMVTIIRDRIEDMSKKGYSLEQVKAAKPTLDYDGLYGSASGSWTTDMFIEAIYKTLKVASSDRN